MADSSRVFGMYDIRGVYPEEVNEEFAYNLAKAFSQRYKPKTIIVACDVRNGSQSIKDKLIKSLIEESVDVIDLGIITTDCFLFACSQEKSFGIMVTASHNPKQFNGFKLEHMNGEPIYHGNGLEKIAKKMQKLGLVNQGKPGKVIQKDYRKSFSDFVLSNTAVENLKKYKIVVDSSNGTAATIGDILLDFLNQDIFKLNWEKDSNFSGHGPNPLDKVAWASIAAEIKNNKADFAVAFDSDGDRSIFFDENGKFIHPSFVAGVIATEILKSKKKGCVVADLTCSRFFKDCVEKNNGKYITSKVGRVFIRESMKKHTAIFGAESSGHCYYKKGNQYVDNSWLTFILMLQILSESGKKFSELFKETEHYYISDPLKLIVKSKQKALETLKAFDKGKMSLLDGVTVRDKEWWFNVRPSNTEDLLRITIEADTKEIAEQKKDELIALLKDK